MFFYVKFYIFGKKMKKISFLVILIFVLSQFFLYLEFTTVSFFEKSSNVTLRESWVAKKKKPFRRRTHVDSQSQSKPEQRHTSSGCESVFLLIISQSLPHRKLAFISQHSFLLPCTIFIESVEKGLLPPLSIGLQVYGREPLPSELTHLGLHMTAWNWLLQSGRPSAIVIEDRIVLHKLTFPTCLPDGPQVTSLDNYETDSEVSAELLGIDAPPKRTGLIWPAEYVVSSGAYAICNAGARALLDLNYTVGGVVDHLNHVLSRIPFSLAFVSPAPAARAPDMDVLIHGFWLRSEQRAFRCRPELGHFGRRDVWFAAGNMGDFVHSSVRQVNALVWLESQSAPQPAAPLVAKAHALFSHHPSPPGIPWHRLSYVIGSGEMYRERSPGWVDRTDTLAYWVSNCVGSRLRRIEELTRHVATVAMGRCVAAGSAVAEGVAGCPRQPPGNAPLGYNAEIFCAHRRAKLALALENSAHDDYMTEKLWLPLLAGAVPVYHGAPNVREWLPHPDAAIVLADFSDTAAAGAYLRAVLGDRALWERHTAWRARPLSGRFVHLLRNGLPNLFCNADLALLLPLSFAEW